MPDKPSPGQRLQKLVANARTTRAYWQERAELAGDELKHLQRDNAKLREALEYELAENKKLKFGAVLPEFELFVAAQGRRIAGVLEIP